LGTKSVKPSRGGVHNDKEAMSEHSGEIVCTLRPI
jgi:hypothetical protein